MLGLLDAVRGRSFAVANAIIGPRYEQRPDSTTGSHERDVCPSRRCARPRPSNAATTNRAAASTASGRSRAPITSAKQPSGVARLASASRSPCGSWPTAVPPHPAPHRTVRKLYLSRGAVEREFGAPQARKGDAAAAGARYRARATDADLTILAKLATAPGGGGAGGGRARPHHRDPRAGQRGFAAERGILIADTKVEFGLEDGRSWRWPTRCSRRTRHGSGLPTSGSRGTRRRPSTRSSSASG